MSGEMQEYYIGRLERALQILVLASAPFVDKELALVDGLCATIPHLEALEKAIELSEKALDSDYK